MLKFVSTKLVGFAVAVLIPRIVGLADPETDNLLNVCVLSIEYGAISTATDLEFLRGRFGFTFVREAGSRTGTRGT